MTLITFQDGKAVMRDGKIGVSSECCCCCGRCVVPPHDIIIDGGSYRVRDSYAEPRWRTQAECERCRMCVESLSTECNGDCPGGAFEVPVSLAFSADCGSGAAGTVKIGCGAVLSASLTDGGSGYATETYAEPTLTATASGGTGGVLSINGYSKLGGYWVITGITVVDGGTGYANSTPVTVNLGAGDEQQPGVISEITAYATLRPPADDWTLQNGSPEPTGTGLVISLDLITHPTSSGSFWVDAWWIVDGGTGYAVGQRIRPLANEGNDAPSPLRANLEITAVDASGAVVALALVGTTTTARNNSRGRYAIGTGAIESVTISSYAGFRKRAVTVCDVDVSIIQTAPSAGSNAAIEATVDSTPSSPTFGKVTGLTVTNGGSGYIALCEKKTTVASCDDCPTHEAPESSTCDDTGGCPCGTWVCDSDQTACECCKWTNPDWGVVLMNHVDSYGEPVSCMDTEVECGKLRDKMLLIRSYFEQAGWTVTLDENWCPPNVLDVWGNVYPFLDPENPCACGFLFRAECDSCNRAYPAHIRPQSYAFLEVDDPELGIRPFEARPYDLSQWVAMPITAWQHEIPACSPTQFSDVISIWPPTYGGFARVVYCEHAPSGMTGYKDPLGSVVPFFNFAKVGYPLATYLIYGAFDVGGGQIHGGGLIPGYYSGASGATLGSNNDDVLYIPKCGVEITERARCVLTAPGEQYGWTGPVIAETWATCCTECPTGYRCLFAGDPLDGTTIEENPLP